MTPSDTRSTEIDTAGPVTAPSAVTLRKPYREPTLTEQGDLSEVTAGAFGDQSP